MHLEKLYGTKGALKMITVFDGAMGTMLHKAGMTPGECPEQWNIDHPSIVTDIHRQYVESGSDIIGTNTFGANRIKLKHYGLHNQVEHLNTAAVKAARAACGSKTRIAGSIGPTGKFITPLGDLTFDTAYDVFYEQAKALSNAGVDIIIIETIIDIQEMRAALLAAKAATNKPIICQLSFEADGRTLTGTDARSAAVILEAMGADIIGANCSLGPAQLLPILTELTSSSSLPIIIQPNAGIPELIHGQTVFPMGPTEFATWATKLIEAGASYIGGCCGTTPEHIKALKSKLSPNPKIERPHTPKTALTSRNKTIYIGEGLPTTIIGERINPTGRKAMAADIRSGNIISVKKEALAQVKAGAHILDVNMGVPGINQPEVMRSVIEQLSILVDTPLAIDTTDPESLEAGLRAFPGRALVNSVSAEPERLEAFLPLAKKYGAAILCLPISSSGVPTTAQERIDVINTILSAALEIGLRPQDFLLDALVMTVAADSTAAKETLKTLRLYRKNFGYPAVMGLSNVSYGLPRRDLMNSAFYAMAVASGLDAPILNPYDPMMKDMLAATAPLLGHDMNGKNYSTTYAKVPNTPIATAPTEKMDILTAIKQTVINGEKESMPGLIRQGLADGYSPIKITDESLTAAMNEIGIAFGEGRCYLPQVMLAAETMRSAFLTIKEVLPAHQTKSTGTIVIATVKGDIHDLGKNIVSALLENNGFKVIDLGKDVSPETIVQSAIKEQADIVGLCALMTTTLPQINATITALKAAGVAAKTIVGGAVLTLEYANEAGADAYASNGVEAVNIAKQMILTQSNS